MISEDDAPALELALDPPSLNLPPRAHDDPVPTTALIERRVRAAEQPPRVFNNGLLIGQYQLVGELGRAPTALLVEARDPDGKPVILQIARLRAAHSPIEKVERHYFEQRVAEATALEAADHELGLLAHGAADRPDGSRVLFWALPWREEARDLIHPDRRLRAPRRLCQIGIALAHRLAKRHSYGRMDPLLSEQSILILRSGGADVIGAPIFLASEWLDPDLAPVRLAPEEAVNLTPRPTGDLWRLGTALQAMAMAYGEVPEPLAMCLQSFLRTDPAQRVLRATEAIVELEAVHAALSPHDASIDPIVIAETAKIGALGPDAVNSLLLNASADSTRLQATYIPSEVDVARTELDRAQAILPDPPSRDRIAELASGGPTEVETPADLQATELGAPALKRREEASPTRLFVHDRTDKEEIVAPSIEHDATSSTLQDTPLAQLIEQERALASPSEVRAWSEISPALRRELASNTAAATPLPRAIPLVAPRPRTEEYYPPPRAPRMDLKALKADELDTAIKKAALPSPIWRRAALAGFAALALAGAGLLAYTVWPREEPRVQVSSADEVELVVTPDSALVIAELDGRMLGKTPMIFLVAPNVERAVMVYREGYEPQRIMLPERGRVHIELRPIEKREPCSVELSAPRGTQLEGVGAELNGFEHHSIPGAAVVRAKAGGRAQGAWLVRCPPDGRSNAIELKSRARSELHTIELISPQGVPVYADGIMAGAQTKVSGAFAELRMEIGGRSIERWLATDSDATVQLTP